MDIFSLKNLSVLIIIITFSNLALLSYPLDDLQDNTKKLSVRKEGNQSENQLIENLKLYFEDNNIPFYPISYDSSYLVQSFSKGLRVSLDKESDENVYFVFPLDQKDSSEPSSGNLGMNTSLEAIKKLFIEKEKIKLKKNIHFVFLGGEFTREVSVGSYFFLRDSSLNFDKSVVYYFNISNFKKWTILTRGKDSYFSSPSFLLTTLLETIKKFSFTSFYTKDTFPLKGVFQDYEREPFLSYQNYPIPIIFAQSSYESYEEDKKIYNTINWKDFYLDLSQNLSHLSANNSRSNYFFFSFLNYFVIIESFHYLIFLIILANVLTLVGFFQISYFQKRARETFELIWYFLFLFSLFLVSIIISDLFSSLITLSDEIFKSFSSLEIYRKISFSLIVSLLLLYVSHPVIRKIPRQSYLYMALFYLLLLGLTSSFYNLLYSFFFIIGIILICLSLITSYKKLKIFFSLLSLGWVILSVEQGIGNHQTELFLNNSLEGNFILSLLLFPFFLLFLSHTYSLNLKYRKNPNNITLSIVQILLVCLLILKTIIYYSKNPEKNPVIYCQRIWESANSKIEKHPNTSQWIIASKNIDQKNIKKLYSLLIKSKATQLLDKPNSLAKISWEKEVLFRRHDYTILIEFPSEVENIDIIMQPPSKIPVITYGSNFPYETDLEGKIHFKIGPNPPRNLKVSYSLDSSIPLDVQIKFTPSFHEKTTIKTTQNIPLLIEWREIIIQNINIDKTYDLNEKNEFVRETFEKNPTFDLLEKLPIPQKRLFNFSENSS